MRRYASPSTLEDLSRDANELRAQLNAPADPKQAASSRFETQKKLNLLEERIESMTPPKLEGSRKDAASARANLLKQAVVGGGGNAPPMPNQHEMRLNPYGAVDKQIRFDRFWNSHNLDENGDPVKSNYSALNELQDTLLALANSDGEYSENPNAANLEMFRPVGRKPGLAEANPYIGEGTSFALSPKAKENFDQIFPDRKLTAMERRLAEFEARQAKLEEENEQLKRAVMAANPAPPLRCAATTKAGKPCPTNPAKGSQYCMIHRKLLEE